MQGGVRVAAFASGGLLPPTKRGTRSDGLVALADVYTTLCALAGADPSDPAGAAAGLPPVDGLDLSEMLLSPTTSASPRVDLPLMPMKRSDLLALDAHSALMASLRGETMWDVQLNHSCHNNFHKFKFIHKLDTWQLCEAACGAEDECKQFAYSHDAKWCSLQNTTSAPLSNADFDCGCKTACAPGPSPPGPSPPGPSPPPHKGTCYKLEECSSSGAPFESTPTPTVNECCTRCASRSSTVAGPDCAMAVWVHNSSECRLFGDVTGWSNGKQSTCWFPSALGPPPAPIIQGQAGFVEGDLKVIVGTDVNMSPWQGPQYPNASTHYNDSKVPGFACSAPHKVGCLFNVTSDPTEHEDLALSRPGDLQRLLAKLRNASSGFFNPARGDGDPRACEQAVGPYRGAWLLRAVA